MERIITGSNLNNDSRDNSSSVMPEEDKAKVNNVIPLSLLLGFNNQSHQLINIVCSQKGWDMFPLN